MAIEVTLGRDTADKKQFGERGLIYLGKGYVTMGTHVSLSNIIKLDVARTHAMLIAGKRGSGKSYTLGVIAEELAHLPRETARNIASVIFDTMGIFWTMKFTNEKDTALLRDWNLTTSSIPLTVLVPFGKAEEYREKNLPFDATFALKPSELKAEDWCTVFNLTFTSPQGVLIQNICADLPADYSLHEVRTAIEHSTSPEEVKASVRALFNAVKTWGIFTETVEGTEIKDLVKPGGTTVIDVSVYSSIGAFNIRALVISLITRKLFEARTTSRKTEELAAVRRGNAYRSYSETQDPLLWLFVDEAHEFLPREGKTPATDALLQVLREGRQPGLSLVLATQQPGKIHTDVMTQSDIVIAHKVTAAQDLAALQEIMQSYIFADIKQKMDELPPEKGAALILDDTAERLYPIRVRPRFTWHGGEAPTAIKAELEL